MNHPEEFIKTSPNCIIKWVLKERQHLASLSLCLSEALVANARRDQAKRLGITLVGQVTVDVGRDLVS